MNIPNWLHKTTLITLASLMFTSTSYASTISDLKKQKQNQHAEVVKSQKQKTELEKTFDQYVKDIANEESGLNMIQLNIQLISDELNQLKKEITKLESQIKEIEKDIYIQEEELEKKQTMLSDTIREVYKYGEDTVVELLFNSEDIATFLFKVDYSLRIADQVKKMNNEIEHSIEVLSNKKEQVANVKGQMETKQREINDKKAKLETKENEMKESIKSIQIKKDGLHLKIKQQNEIIEQLIHEEMELQEQIIQAENTSRPTGDDTSDIVGNDVIDLAYKWLNQRGLDSSNPVIYSMPKRQLSLSVYGDCSSFTRRIFLDAGKGDIGLNTSQQLSNRRGQYISRLSDLHPGDLMYFGPTGNHRLGAILPDGRRVAVSHVAIYVGNNKMIDLSASVETIALKDFSNGAKWSWYVESRFIGGKRF